ncbi:MAG TPA: radical SAM protein [Methylomirabilota bacterium]|jgi:radical SAM protein with 4Fe4S-binding SPASM domain|nr:radical SAM protein [Methylomirabilota bacterium]
MTFSVGIGLTNECDLRCPHCYRPDATLDRLSLVTVQRVCDAIPVGSMNLGVGENGLHPEYRAVLDYLAARGIKTSITSNGASIACLSDAEVRRFRSVEFSIDFPTEAAHDAFRGAGNWRAVQAGLARCQGLGVPVTVTTVLMRPNARAMPGLVEVARRVGANLRVNVYQPAKTDGFTLPYDEFWDAFRRLADCTRLVATSEPVLAAVLGLEGFAGPGCGRSTVRVAPDGRILPCTYWPASTLTVESLVALGPAILSTAEFAAARQVPGPCAGCPCRGGCAGRRALVGGLDAADVYCPFARGDPLRLDWPRAAGQDLPKVGSACTTVVAPA